MAGPADTLSNPTAASAEWLKIDFHIHTGEDPKDDLDHSAIELLHRARDLGFHALAITLHDHVLDDPAVFAEARKLGILLISGAELRLDGADVVIVNISPEEARELRHLDDLREFRRRRGNSAFIFVPHPFYILGGSMGGRLLRKHIEVFDAIEISYFHTRWLDPNRRAVKAAHRFGKPLIATSDTHRLSNFGRHYSLVQAPSDAAPEALFDAIRAGCIRQVSPPLSDAQFAKNLRWIFVQHPLERLRKCFRGK